ncbi:MAG: transglycosylase SLT domain-containing protein [Ignavibacteria bacterium]|jgi:Rod binding domain-containing protein
MSNIQLKISNPQHIKEPKQIDQRFNDAQKTKLAKASKDFESLLTTMMLKSMTKSTNGLFGDNNYGGNVLDTFFEQELSNHITGAQGFGIAEQIYKKITGEELNMEELVKFKSNNTNETQIKSIDKGSSTVTPSSSAETRLKKYEPIIKEASDKYGIPQSLIKSVILTESAAKENAVSSANAKGLMQLMDETAKDMGVKNVWNPKENIFGGTKYLSQMMEKYDGNINKTLAAYNAGPGNVDKYEGIPPFSETQNYVKRVLNYLNYMES